MSVKEKLDELEKLENKKNEHLKAASELEEKIRGEVKDFFGVEQGKPVNLLEVAKKLLSYGASA